MADDGPRSTLGAALALVALAGILTACSATTDETPVSPSPTSSEAAVIEMFCEQVDALARQVEALQSSPNPREARRVAEAASLLTDQSAAVSDAVVSQPELTGRLRECSARLQAISAGE